MSINQLYQNTKKDKQDASAKVLYTGHTDELKCEFEKLKVDSKSDTGKLAKALENLTAEMTVLKDAVKELQNLNMTEFTEKHGRMKDNFNKLVQSYNEFLTETSAVVLDISKRLNDVEARLSL